MRRFTSRSKRWVVLAVVIGAGLLLAACSAENNRQNSLKPKGPAADKIDSLFTPVFWVAVVVGVLVLGAVVVFALRFRYRAGKNENPKQIHGSTRLEIGWTIVPALILAAVAVPTIITIFDLSKEPTGDVVNVTAVGKQWWWEFKYPDQNIVTADELVIPAGRPAGPAQDLMSTKFQCTTCHSVGDSKVSSYGPNLTHLASRTTFASGYYELTRDRLIEWVHNAPGLIPMQSKACREAGEPAAGKGVGMPSFSRDTPAGQPTMTQQEAVQIADYLLQLKGTTARETPHDDPL